MVDYNPALTAKLEEAQNRTALFHNFSDYEFIGYWNGRGRKFAAGAKVFMPLWQAEHYAKHLANEILLRRGDPKSVASTSPKEPTQVPLFNELFIKACILQDDGEPMSAEDSAINLANRLQPKAEKTPLDKEEPQTIAADVADPDLDDEDNFEENKEPSA